MSYWDEIRPNYLNPISIVQCIFYMIIETVETHIFHSPSQTQLRVRVCNKSQFAVDINNLKEFIQIEMKPYLDFFLNQL